jgi:hypothetical protein
MEAGWLQLPQVAEDYADFIIDVNKYCLVEATCGGICGTYVALHYVSNTYI